MSLLALEHLSINAADLALRIDGSAVAAGAAQQRFGHLPSAPHQRIERGQRLLEHRCSHRAAQAVEDLVGGTDDLRVAERDLTGHAERRCQQAGGRHRG